MGNFAVVCVTRSGSYYFYEYLCKTFDLVEGSEWFGRVKQVHYKGMKTSPVNIDHSVNEDLLTNDEITKRLVHLKNYTNPFIIKCMPFQLSNTIERVNLPYEERMEIATKILNNFSLIYLVNEDKVSQFCFDVISKNQDHVKRNYTSYNPDIRETPPDNSMTATREHYESFKQRQGFVEMFQHRNWKGEPVIVWEEFVTNHNSQTKKIQDWYGIQGTYGDANIGMRREIIPHPDYSKIFTNYGEIERWFG